MKITWIFKYQSNNFEVQRLNVRKVHVVSLRQHCESYRIPCPLSMKRGHKLNFYTFLWFPVFQRKINEKRNRHNFSIHPCLIFNLLNPTGYVMHQQFNIQQLYVLPTLYLCVLYVSENKQRLVPLTA